MRLFGLMGFLALVVAFPVRAQVHKEHMTPPKIEVVGDKKDDESQRTGVVITATSGEWDKVADEAGQIYLSRGYKGVVPGVRDSSAVPAKAVGAEEGRLDKPVLEWVGFQPFSTYSRVFLQLKGDFRFNVTKPKPDRIELRLPNTVLSTENDLRFLNTREFPTAVDRVMIDWIEKSGTGYAVVTIYLKKPVGYLYRQEGDYIFVDIGL